MCCYFETGELVESSSKIHGIDYFVMNLQHQAFVVGLVRHS